MATPFASAERGVSMQTAPQSISTSFRLSPDRMRNETRPKPAMRMFHSRVWEACPEAVYINIRLLVLLDTQSTEDTVFRKGLRDVNLDIEG